MRLRGHLAVFVLWLGLVALYTWPLVRGLGHLWPANHDPRLFTWVMLTIFRNLTTQPAALFHGNAFYPVGQSLTFAEPLLTPALLAGPLHALTGNPVLAYNVTLLLFWALSGWAMHAVTFALTRSHAAAVVAAAVFTLAPYRTELYLEFQMEIAFGIPLCVYTLVRFLEGQRTRDLLAFLVVFWLQAIAVWYYAVILAFGLAVLVAQYAALRWTGWRLPALARAAAGGVALVAALVPVAWPFFVTRRELGFERGLADVDERSADVLTYLELHSNWLYRVPRAGHFFETSLFLGAVALALAGAGLLWLRGGREARGPAERWLGRAMWVCLALAGVGLVVRRGLPFTALAVAGLFVGLGRQAVEGWRRWRAGVEDRRLGERDWVAMLLGLALVAFLLSLGPHVEVAGQSIDTGLYAWLYPYLLPLRAIRAVTRVGALVVFAGALLAGLGTKWLSQRLPRSAAAVVIGIAGVLLLLEYATFPLAYGRVAPGPRPVDEALRRVEPDAVILEWPTNVPDADADAMFRSVGHGRRIVNGYSGFVPEMLRELSGLLTTRGDRFPVDAAQAALRRIYPLRYLVVRLDDPAIEPDWHPTWLALRREAPPLLRFRGSFGTADLYEIVPLPERGGRLERWVSYDVLRARPVLRLTAAPLVAGPALEQWVEVRLNGRLIARTALAAPTTATVRLSPPFNRAAPNVLTLRHAYRRPRTARDERYRIGTTGSRSPVDVRVRSGGQPWGDRASIEVNGVERAAGRRGYNLVAIDPGGELRDTAVFDTFSQPEAPARLAGWVAALPAGTVVAGAVKDEASGRLTDAAVRALELLGVGGDLRGRFRESHAFVGVKGAPAGTALEALGPRPVELIVGEPEAGLGIELEEFRLDPAAG